MSEQPVAWRDSFRLSLTLGAIAVWDLSSLDLGVMRIFGSTSGFALRDHWFLKQVMHDDVRVLAWMALAGLLVMLWRAPGRLQEIPASERAWWFLATLGCALAVPLIKQVSATSCPWSLTEFGGTATYVPHWLPGRLDHGPGHCFPSGHVTNAFAFITGWFVLRRRWPWAARCWLGAVVLAGFTLGAIQVARGAHYPSHVLWSGWITWAIAAATYHLGHGEADVQPRPFSTTEKAHAETGNLVTIGLHAPRTGADGGTSATPLVRPRHIRSGDPDAQFPAVRTLASPPPHRRHATSSADPT